MAEEEGWGGFSESAGCGGGSIENSCEFSCGIVSTVGPVLGGFGKEDDDG